MKFSIITVCYNCEKLIVKTMDSLLQQDYTDYEYIVVDGASQDATFQLVKQYEDRFNQIALLSEPDKGIYDAMNKAIKIAKGDYVFFLNAGDVFFSNTVLQEVSKYLVSGKDIYYGAVLKGPKIENYPSKIYKWWLVYFERMMCHQAIFTKRSVFEEELFDLKYRICADREWFIRLIQKKIAYQRMPGLIVTDYDLHGISTNDDLFEKESNQIVIQYAGKKGLRFVVFKRKMGKFLRRKHVQNIKE